MIKLTKKQLLIVVLIALFGGTLVFLMTKNEVKTIVSKNKPGEIKKLVEENKLDTEEIFVEEKSKDDKQNNDERAVSTLREILLAKADIVGGDKKAINDDLDAALDAIKNGNYKEAMDIIEGSIDTSNQAVNDYLNKNKADISQIDAVTRLVVKDVPRMKTQNTNIINEWAVSTVYAEGLDPANTVLKKENGSWKIIIGPGTGFTPEELMGMGISAVISEKAMIFNKEDLLTTINT